MLHVPPVGITHQVFTSYQELMRRIHKQINSSDAQLRRQTVIVRLSDESEDDWETFLDQLDIDESVRVVRLEGGLARLTWTNQHLSHI
ncbi:hypothetical protein M2401_006246 [Pseudomonas sp. JUb42]|uniref:DUF1654 domain-containing protein n=1 Tax=Pseudomonas sp. JUb42 TaxID=2940611 RepID=UPI0021679BA5|nr:DUF1654 domain-containing protein [Pseudomonas sp. JUb42]MCS3472482.1 hypothetical protein [Pseudomonas sp. JUb42]